MSTDPILEVGGLEVSYGKVRAISGAAFQVRRGAITAIIGSNGAGKSTIMKAIAGLVPPGGGSIRFDGEEIVGRSVDDIVKRGVVLVPEGRRLFKSMTVRENLLMGAYRRTDSAGVAADLEKALGYFPVLRERLGQRARNLSGGQQQMLAVARALMSSPRMMLLDEPSIGLAPVIVQVIADIIRAISQAGVDILLVEQNAQLALKLSQHAYVIENGEIMMEGASADLADSDFVRRAYLGI